MGLVHSIPTREEFNARIAEITAKYPFLANEGCEINVMPGWLPAIETCLLKLHKLSKGKINFFVAQRNASGSVCTAFFEADLPEKSGRHKAIEKAIEHLQVDIGSVCKFCGTPIESDSFYASSASSCPSHKTITSGCFEGELSYEDTEPESGIYTQPDAGEIAIEALNLMFDPQFYLSESLQVQDAVERLVTFLQTSNSQARSNRKVPTPKYQADKAEVFKKLEEAIKKKTEPETEAAGAPANINTTGRVHPTMVLYKAQDLEEMWSKSQVRDRKQMIEPYYKKAKALSPVRYYAIVSDTWRDDLDALADDFPNFAEVIGYLRQQFALADRGDGRVHFPPLLLAGPSGIGKTLLSQTLAGMVRTSYAEIHMEVEQNGSALTGTSAYWANTSPGKIADVLLMNEAANPIVVVDELDKAGGDARYDPMAGLYSLLEPGTAKRFEDLCFGFPVDASAICWVFTANEVGKIPLPIMSRLKLFNVPAPTKEQTMHIAHRVYASLLKSHWGKAFDEKLPAEVAEALGQREPRVIRNVLLSALGNAAIDERTSLVVQDLDGALPSRKRADSEYQNNKIGFVGEK